MRQMITESNLETFALPECVQQKCALMRPIVKIETFSENGQNLEKSSPSFPCHRLNCICLRGKNSFKINKTKFHFNLFDSIMINSSPTLQQDWVIYVYQLLYAESGSSRL
jgi:hypothetical protein